MKTVSVSVLFVMVSVTVPKSVGVGGNSSGTGLETVSGCLTVTVTTAEAALFSDGIIESNPLYGLGHGKTRFGDGEGPCAESGRCSCSSAFGSGLFRGLGLEVRKVLPLSSSRLIGRVKTLG